MSDIVERLREMELKEHDVEAAEAADEITALRAQVAALTARGEALETALADLISWMDVWLEQSRATAKTAEWAVDAIEAGRAALTVEP